MSIFAKEQEEQKNNLHSNASGSSVKTAIDIEEDVNVQFAKEYY